MKSVSKSLEAVAHGSDSAQSGSVLIASFVGSLIATTAFLQPAAYPTTLNLCTKSAADFVAVAEESEGTRAPVEKRNDKAGKLAELERAFWVCDQAATTQKIDMHQAVTCATVTDKLRRAKFGGDFEKLIEWWRISKVA